MNVNKIQTHFDKVQTVFLYNNCVEEEALGSKS